MRPHSFVLFLLCTGALCACDPAPPRVTVVSSTPAVLSQHYETPAEQTRFKEALSGAGVRFTTEVRHGKEFVSWEAGSASAVAGVQSSLFGPELPSGRNYASDGPRHDQFKHWLTANGIPFSVQLSRGREFVVWEQQYTQRVYAWPEFPEALKK